MIMEMITITTTKIRTIIKIVFITMMVMMWSLMVVVVTMMGINKHIVVLI